LKAKDENLLSPELSPNVADRFVWKRRVFLYETQVENQYRNVTY